MISGSAGIAGRRKLRIESNTAIFELPDEHTIAVAVKPVPCINSVAIGVHYKFMAAKC